MSDTPSLPIEQVKPHAADCALMQKAYVYEDLGRPSFDWPQPAIECTCQAASPSDPPVGKDSSAEELSKLLDALEVSKRTTLAPWQRVRAYRAARIRVESLFAKQREEIAFLRKQFYETQQSSSDEVLGLKAQLERQRETTLTPEEARLSNTPEFPSPEWYAKVRGKKTGRPASEEPQELKEALDTMERHDATGNELIAARTTISRYVAQQREEIDELKKSKRIGTNILSELTEALLQVASLQSEIERQRGEAKALQATIDALQTSHAADVRGLKAQLERATKDREQAYRDGKALERQRETTLTPEEARFIAGAMVFPSVISDRPLFNSVREKLMRSIASSSPLTRGTDK